MLELTIGNKSYSSWSLRGWLPLAHWQIPFREKVLNFFTPEFHSEVAQISSAGLVPVLVDDGFAIWDSLAIAEYLAERFPDRALWPANPRQRARARSVCAQMHAGFTTLRAHMPMNTMASLPGRGWNLAVQKDIDSITALWTRAIDESGGPYLFGANVTIADCFFAPVCSRFATYTPALTTVASSYVQGILALPAMQRWYAEARAEFKFIAEEEPYRASAFEK